MPSARKPKASVKKRLISKDLALRLEERLEDSAVEVPEAPRPETPPPEPAPRPQTPLSSSPPSSPPGPVIRRTERTERSRVMIIERPREAMPNQIIPLTIHDFPTRMYTPVRIGVDRVGGSIMHCIIRATYPPYMDWNREKRIRKVKEFRQDLARNFEGYYMRMDQKRERWGPIYACKRELEIAEGVFRYDFLDYIGKIINKNICILELTVSGKVQPIPGTRVYGKGVHDKSSPYTMLSRSRTHSPSSSEPPTTIFILHLGGGAYELVGMLKNEGDERFTLFPENHLLYKLMWPSL